MKYSGSDEEHLQDFVDSYAITAEDYGLSATHKLQYLHNLFRGDALRFYNSQVKGTVSTCGEAIHTMIGHFNSPGVQRRVKDEISTLSLNTFVEKDGHLLKGLSSVATYIANRTPQCPPCFRSESKKVDFPKQAVLEQPRAREVLVRINSRTQFRKGHKLSQHHKPLDLTRIAANKASYYAKKGDKKNNTKHVLFELVKGMNKLCDSDSTFDTKSVRACFGNLIDNEDKTCSSSESEKDDEAIKSHFVSSGGNNVASESESDSDFQI